MELKGKVVVVTGGADGIGRALCRRFAAEGADGVVVADLNIEGAQAVAREIGGLAVPTDVAVEAEVVRLVQRTMSNFGRIDLFCSNAGIGSPAGGYGGIEAPNDAWRRSIEVNTLAHVHAARAVLPMMLQRGQGYLLQTISASAFLNNLTSAPYAVSKYAALGFAEWLSIQYHDMGIRVSCLCPMGVRTKLLTGQAGETKSSNFLLEGAIEPDEVAESVVQGLAAERFFILPHEDVATHMQRKANDWDRWLRGSRRLRARVKREVPRPPQP